MSGDRVPQGQTLFATTPRDFTRLQERHSALVVVEKALQALGYNPTTALNTMGESLSEEVATLTNAVADVHLQCLACERVYVSRMPLTQDRDRKPLNGLCGVCVVAAMPVAEV